MRRILSILEGGITAPDARRVGRVADDSEALIRGLEKMPGGLDVRPSAGWCKRAREVIEALWSLRGALVESSARTRRERCDPLLGAAARAIRAVESAGWALPGQCKAAPGRQRPGEKGNAAPGLNDTDRRALDYIRAHPGMSGETIARAIGGRVEHFRSRVVPKLKAHGVTNSPGDGYRVGGA